MTKDQGKEPLLRQILEALKATEESAHVENSSKDLVEESDEGRNDEESSKNLLDNNKEEKNDDTEEPSEEQETDGESEKVSKLVAALEKLERVHREENEILVEANNNPGVAKVSKMQKKIQHVKENLGTKEKKRTSPSRPAKCRRDHGSAPDDQEGR